MREFKESNVTLLEDDDGSLYLYVQDETAPIAVQELAILPIEIERIRSVIEKYTQPLAEK